MAETHTVKDICLALIGPVEPCGEHAIDVGRIENLKALCDLHAELSEIICEVSGTAHGGRASMKAMSDYAHSHIALEHKSMSDVIFQNLNILERLKPQD